MFRFTREKILPLFLQRRMTTEQLARSAGVSHKTAERAVNGLPVTARVIECIANALNIRPIDFLVHPNPNQ